MSHCKLSAFADEYAVSFQEQLYGLRQFGIAYIEIRHVDGKNISVLSKEEIKEVKRRLDDFGVQVSAIGSPLGKIPLDGDMAAHMDMAKRVYEAASVLETKYVRVFSFYAPSGKNIAHMKDQVWEALARLLALADAYGITLCHENEANIYGDTPERCRELIDCFDGALKCVFDMGNFVLEGVDPYPEAYSLLQKDIAYFHVKDALAAGAVVPPGKGEARIREILTAHKQYADEDFFVSLEPHLQTFSGLNALVGRSFENPYQYADAETAFTDTVTKCKELI